MQSFAIIETLIICTFGTGITKKPKETKKSEKPEQGDRAVLPLTKRYSSGKEKIEKGKVKKEKWEKKNESEKIKVKVKT